MDQEQSNSDSPRQTPTEIARAGQLAAGELAMMEVEELEASPHLVTGAERL